MCPGTQAGTFDTEQHIFVNFSFGRTLENLKAMLALLRENNPKLKVILTVSPVPLVATAVTNAHALVPNTYTKSVLRAVAGEVAGQYSSVDYSPSYELISHGVGAERFFEPNLRSVTTQGATIS
ncbi:GSCFA domain-containing protein [Maricaulaceae bacterium EIL42A08]|nr:GSCFA domain-containing protein [Maricaulaceae bacterium EIL42A08]